MGSIINVAEILINIVFLSYSDLFYLLIVGAEIYRCA